MYSQLEIKLIKTRPNEQSCPLTPASSSSSPFSPVCSWLPDLSKGWSRFEASVTLQSGFCSHSSTVLVLSRGDFTSKDPFDNVWSYFWLLRLRGCYWHPVDRGQGAAKHPPMHGTAPTAKIINSKASTVLRLRSPALLNQFLIGSSMI